MTAAQGFLHASLLAHGELARAVTSLNTFLHSRSSAETFLTLWIGLFDPHHMSLEYVDAGHGYATMLKSDQSTQWLDENGGVPIGAAAGIEYQTATAHLSPGDGVLIFSDGIVEQTSNDSRPDGRREEFGKERVHAAIRGCDGKDLLAGLFQALNSFAGGRAFTDDVTGVLVRCA
jgi:serine phosphatase RsbU (regulator of sigma subunit)